MPAHWCIYKLMFYIYLIKYLFNISEYKAMLIKLLIYQGRRKVFYVGGAVGGGDILLLPL